MKNGLVRKRISTKTLFQAALGAVHKTLLSSYCLNTLKIKNAGFECFMAFSSSVSFQENCAIVRVNPRVYPVSVVLSAAYALLDKGYFWVGGNSLDKEIVVEVKSKNGTSRQVLEKLCENFSDELLNCAVYSIQAANNKPVREAILRAALFANMQKPDAVSSKEKKGRKSSFKADPEDIAKPWTEDKRP